MIYTIVNLATAQQKILISCQPILIFVTQYDFHALSFLMIHHQNANYIKTFKIIWLSNLSTLSVLDEGYSKNVSCALNLISTILLLSLGRYFCWWTISPRGYHPPSSQCFYHWVDTSAGGLLVSEGIIRSVVSVSILTWFIRYIYY